MVDIPVRYLSIRVRTEVRLGVRNLYGICDTALKHTNRTVRAPALPLALLRATVDARRLHRAAPYTEVQALALHTHTRKERSSSAASERSSDRPRTPIYKTLFSVQMNALLKIINALFPVCN